MALSLCGQTVANTGELACDKSKGTGKKLFIFNGAIGSADYANPTVFLAKLAANSKLSKDAANKVFVINEMQDIADASESNTEATLGLGFKAIIREGKPAYTIKLFAGSDLLKRLRTFNNQTIRVLEYDSNNVVWGTKRGNDFIGYQCKMFFTGGNLATGQNVEEGVITLTLSIISNSEYKDNSYWMDIDGNIEDVRGLMDVTMIEKSNASNVYKIGLEIIGSHLKGGYNIWDDMGAAIAGTTFTAGTGANYGTPLTITSVAADNTLKCLTVTFDSSAYTGLDGGTSIRLVPPTPTVLDVADATDIEILPLIITKPA